MLYVRNLTQDCSEEKLKESFEAFGKVERVKKIKDYAFIHFEDRDNAMAVCILIITVFRSVQHCVIDVPLELYTMFGAHSLWKGICGTFHRHRLSLWCTCMLSACFKLSIHML